MLWMPETEPIKTRFEVDDRQVKAKFDEFEKRIKSAEASGKKAGKGVSAFAAAAIGGAAGFVASAAESNPAISSLTDLLMNIVAAALLPVIMKLLPLIQTLGDVLGRLADIVAPIVKPIADAAGAIAKIQSDVIGNIVDIIKNPGSLPGKINKLRNDIAVGFIDAESDSTTGPVIDKFTKHQNVGIGLTPPISPADVSQVGLQVPTSSNPIDVITGRIKAAAIDIFGPHFLW